MVLPLLIGQKTAMPGATKCIQISVCSCALHAKLICSCTVLFTTVIIGFPTHLRQIISEVEAHFSNNISNIININYSTSPLNLRNLAWQITGIDLHIHAWGMSLVCGNWKSQTMQMALHLSPMDPESRLVSIFLRFCAGVFDNMLAKSF